MSFGVFLRLPGYAEMLLKERRKAQCLLRLVLGENFLIRVCVVAIGIEIGVSCPLNEACGIGCDVIVTWHDHHI